MTVVGIISDTHGRLDARAYAAMAEADFIIHAGDIGDLGILHELESLAPVAAVLGNNDFDEYGSRVGRYAYPVVDGVRFLVSHYPQSVRIGFNGCAGLAAGDPLPHVCVHGHTHIPRLDAGKDARPADYVICPGSASRPRGDNPRSIAYVLIEDGRVSGITIEGLDGTILLKVGKGRFE